MPRGQELQYLRKLLQVLDKCFDEGELRTLCFHLDVDYDSLPGEGKANKARELVAYLERRGRIPELVETGKQLRPDVSWENALEATGEASLGQPVGKTQVTKLDVLRAVYQVYKDEPGEKVNSERIRKNLGLSREQMNDIILALRERGFIKTRFLGDRALLEITADGVTVLES
jgi:predicted transcriptional regulator